jgi:hypothetical protein
MTTSYKWPTREEWAKQERTPYYDLFKNLPVSEELKDYATPQEIAAAVVGLKELYRTEGRKLKEAKRLAGPLAPQPRERIRDHYARYVAMTEHEKELSRTVGNIQDVRHESNKVLRCITKGYLPLHIDCCFRKEIEPVLATIKARYDAAKKTAEVVRLRQIEATPIDDAAWEEELRRRASLEKEGWRL